LVVDDDAAVRIAVRALLESAGLTILEAANGIEAIKYIDGHEVDVVLCDLFMPEADGIELIQQLRRAFPRIGIVAMSGGGLEGKVHLLPVAQRLGASSVLDKPFDLPTVLAAIHTALSSPQS
jgi:two-component system chemotaxis response regulator CheY